MAAPAASTRPDIVSRQGHGRDLERRPSGLGQVDLRKTDAGQRPDDLVALDLGQMELRQADLLDRELRHRTASALRLVIGQGYAGTVVDGPVPGRVRDVSRRRDKRPVGLIRSRERSARQRRQTVTVISAPGAAVADLVAGPDPVLVGPRARQRLGHAVRGPVAERPPAATETRRCTS